ncbi:MAG: hypothetical protein IT475_06070 [Aquimonas sp.]|jgi:hypothetical protein|nr:hypothetical protein [Aquimonas sp.]
MNDTTPTLPSSDIRILIQGGLMADNHAELLSVFRAHGGDPTAWSLPTAGNAWALIALRLGVPEFAAAEGARLIDTLKDDAAASALRLGYNAAVVMMSEALRDPDKAFLRWIAAAYECQQHTNTTMTNTDWESQLWAVNA